MWNGSMGLIAMASLGRIEVGVGGRLAWLSEPYETVGPFGLDELRASGRIAFEACVVMSRQRWQEDQVELRRAAQTTRRQQHERQRRRGGYAHGDRTGRRIVRHAGDERLHRQALNLPIEGRLEWAQINIAFRRLAQKAHPDTGGSHEQFIRITDARNALLSSIHGREHGPW